MAPRTNSAGTSDTNTTTEIADGVDAADNPPSQSDFVGVSVALVNTVPDSANTSASGGSIITNRSGMQLSSGSSTGEFAHVETYDMREAGADNTRIIAGAVAAHGTAIGTANTDYPLIGIGPGFDGDATDNNIAQFNPGAGDSTSGNIRVDDGGTDTDGSISYPDLTQYNYYEVAVDYGASETRFYTNGSDLTDDAATATLAATPTVGGNARAITVGIKGANGSTVSVHALRGGVRWF